MPPKSLSFEQFEIEHLDEVLPAIERVFRKHGLDYYILGGLARDIHFLSEDIRSQRITKDLDLAVYIPQATEYEQLLNDLVKVEGFRRLKENPVRLIHSTQAIVDILPFDERTSSDDSMARFGPAFIDFHLSGLYEVFRHATKVFEIGKDRRFHVTTPAGIVMLKLIAYHDKPERRLKDLEDVGQLLKHYFYLNDNEIYENHNDLFGGDEKLLEAISARVIGRKVRQIVKDTEELHELFSTIIDVYLNQGEEGRLAIVLAKEMGYLPEVVIGFLHEMKAGYLEGLQKDW